MELEYWTGLDGTYLGAFTADSPNLPIHSIQVPNPPPAGIGDPLQGQFRWDGEKWIIPSGGGQDDVQSGRYFVPIGAIYTVTEFFQSIVLGKVLDIEGCLIVDGQLFLED